MLTDAFKLTLAGGAVMITLKKIDVADSIAVPRSHIGLSLAFRIAPGGASSPQPYLRLEVMDSGTGISK